jgi:septal ring factor EnvC (AmiA/AmiB activator)
MFWHFKKTHPEYHFTKIRTVSKTGLSSGQLKCTVQGCEWTGPYKWLVRHYETRHKVTPEQAPKRVDSLYIADIIGELNNKLKDEAAKSSYLQDELARANKTIANQAAEILRHKNDTNNLYSQLVAAQELLARR